MVVVGISGRGGGLRSDIYPYGNVGVEGQRGGGEGGSNRVITGYLRCYLGGAISSP